MARDRVEQQTYKVDMSASKPGDALRAVFSLTRDLLYVLLPREASNCPMRKSDRHSTPATTAIRVPEGPGGAPRRCCDHATFVACPPAISRRPSPGGEACTVRPPGSCQACGLGRSSPQTVVPSHVPVRQGSRKMLSMYVQGLMSDTVEGTPRSAVSPTGAFACRWSSLIWSMASRQLPPRCPARARPFGTCWAASGMRTPFFFLLIGGCTRSTHPTR